MLSVWQIRPIAIRTTAIFANYETNGDRINKIFVRSEITMDLIATLMAEEYDQDAVERALTSVVGLHMSFRHSRAHQAT